jgi:hypothetical protein
MRSNNRRRIVNNTTRSSECADIKQTIKKNKARISELNSYMMPEGSRMERDQYGSFNAATWIDLKAEIEELKPNVPPLLRQSQDMQGNIRRSIAKQAGSS